MHLKDLINRFCEYREGEASWQFYSTREQNEQVRHLISLAFRNELLIEDKI